MRSLWRILALQWLGGEASEALTGDSTILRACCAAEMPERYAPLMCGVNHRFPAMR